MDSAQVVRRFEHRVEAAGVRAGTGTPLTWVETTSTG
jgi:hypothetical protein